MVAVVGVYQIPVIHGTCCEGRILGTPKLQGGFFFNPDLNRCQSTLSFRIQVQKQDGWMNQAYSRVSTTHGHITDCKLLVCMY